MQVTFITDQVLLVGKFHLAAPLLEPVVREAGRGEFTVDDIRRLNAQGEVITALFENDGEPVAAMAFEFVYYPQTLAVNIMAFGGKRFDEVTTEFWDLFKEWCKAAGASFIEASCSDAMARLLGRYGFDLTYRVVRAAL